MAVQEQTLEELRQTQCVEMEMLDIEKKKVGERKMDTVGNQREIAREEEKLMRLRYNIAKKLALND